jgi:hypothetical protein
MTRLQLQLIWWLRVIGDEAYRFSKSARCCQATVQILASNLARAVGPEICLWFYTGI